MICKYTKYGANPHQGWLVLPFWKSKQYPTLAVDPKRSFKCMSP